MKHSIVTVGSLFSGIGGFDLGFQRAGFQIEWQVEIDDYCQRVLAKHWPDVARYGDIRTVTALPYVDVLCGGFPCQDISNAGKRDGIDGDRSGLWSEMVRIIRLVRPQYVIVENVAALLGRGMGRVLGDLSESGYNAEWDCIPASAVGAPHRRDRVWIVAYARREQRDSIRATSRTYKSATKLHDQRCGAALADSFSTGLEGRTGQRGDVSEECQAVERSCSARIFTDSDGQSLGRIAESWGQPGQWAIEPDVGRVAHGISHRVDRLKGLGNALVPQIAEWIGRRILDYEANRR